MSVSRRAFLQGLIGGVAIGAVAERTWPFRVYSFPGTVQLASVDEIKSVSQQTMHKLLPGTVPFFDPHSFRNGNSGWAGLRSFGGTREEAISAAMESGAIVLPIISRMWSPRDAVRQESRKRFGDAMAAYLKNEITKPVA